VKQYENVLKMVPCNDPNWKSSIPQIFQQYINTVDMSIILVVGNFFNCSTIGYPHHPSSEKYLFPASFSLYASPHSPPQAQ
jgi:hypothetical protein